MGANLGRREESLELAAERVEERIGRVVARSRNYETPPLVLPGDEAAEVPNYLNAVIVVESELEPQQILELLLDIEKSLGRDRSQEQRRWQSRIIDLDMLAYGERLESTPSLVLPHPEMQNRRFVLEPLCEVLPEWKHPLLGKTARELLTTIKHE